MLRIEVMLWGKKCTKQYVKRPSFTTLAHLTFLILNFIAKLQNLFNFHLLCCEDYMKVKSTLKLLIYMGILHLYVYM